VSKSKTVSQADFVDPTLIGKVNSLVPPGFGGSASGEIGGVGVGVSDIERLTAAFEKNFKDVEDILPTDPNEVKDLFKTKRLISEIRDKVDTAINRSYVQTFGGKTGGEYIDLRKNLFAEWGKDVGTKGGATLHLTAEESGFGKTIFGRVSPFDNIKIDTKFLDTKEELRNIFLKEAKNSLLDLTNASSDFPLDMSTLFQFEKVVNDKVLTTMFPSGKVKLFRGVNEDFFFARGEALPLVGDVNTGMLEMNSLSSWTIDKEVTGIFGSFIYEVDVPVENVFTNFLITNNLRTSEQEFIVTGKEALPFKLIDFTF